MLGEYVEPDNPLLNAAKRVSLLSDDDCFSAEALAADLRLDVAQILSRLQKLEDCDWVARYEDVLTASATQHSRWLVRENCSLKSGKHYEVLEIVFDSYRILNDRNDPVLYHSSNFRIIDGTEPTFWANEWGEDKERYAGTKEWLQPGFWEDYHDGVIAARDKFWDDLRRLYPWTWSERQMCG
jgi:hypothetical protein